MKAFITNKITVIVLAVVLLAGTGLGIWAAVRNNNKGGYALTVYTSFYPLYDFTQKVGGTKVEVVNLVKPGEEAHHYEPTTQQMASMYDADLIVVNGVEMEAWAEDLDAELTAKLVDTSVGVTLLERTLGTEEPEEHDHVEGEEEHDHGNYDPHIWLSVANAKIQMENIKNALVAADPTNASYYENNFATYSVLFDGLQSQYETALSAANGQVFVTSHKAFGYLAHAYGLTQLSINGYETDGEPDAQTTAEIIDYINTNNVSVVFYQTFVNSKIAERIVSETNATVDMLSTIEGLTESEIVAGRDYLSQMAQNLVALKNAFGV